MAVKNTSLGGTDFATPSARVKPTDLNDTNNQIANTIFQAFNGIGNNLIRQLQDRTVSYSAGNLDWWGEAFIDLTGRNDSVDTTHTITTAAYFTSLSTFGAGVTTNASSDTTHDPDGFTNPSNAFDNDWGTSATISIGPVSGGGNLLSKSIGKTFAAKIPGIVKVYATVTTGGSWTVQPTCSVLLQTYNGSTWSTLATLASATSSVTFDGAYVINTSVQGVRIHIGGNNTGSASGANNGSAAITVYEIQYGTTVTNGEVVMNLPTGTFSTTISQAVGVPKISLWESGADIQYKLTNGSEDSGWLSCSNSPRLGVFTAFTAQPTKLTVKILPKSSSPTPGYPSISGFSVRAW